MSQFSALVVSLLIGSFAFATEGKFEFLKKFETPPKQWTPEISLASPSRIMALPEAEPAADSNLSEFYKEFRADGAVTIYLGFGVEAYHYNRTTEVFNMIKSLAENQKIALSNLAMPNDHQITFEDDSNHVKYEVTIGHERNEFAGAFSKYEVVMYHGHSRYGRGPAFDGFSNYFRMGDVWPIIEVDTRNPYFMDEPIQLTSRYPLQSVDLDGKKYSYQYIGQKEESSYLPSTSYTKNILGGDIDLRNSTYLSGRQIFWFYSCQNRNYWRNSLRALFPDPQNKFVFGTSLDGYWGSRPSAVFIMSVVKGMESSDKVVADLNATGDCGGCFTTY